MLRAVGLLVRVQGASFRHIKREEECGLAHAFLMFISIVSTCEGEFFSPVLYIRFVSLLMSSGPRMRCGACDCALVAKTKAFFTSSWSREVIAALLVLEEDLKSYEIAEARLSQLPAASRNTDTRSTVMGLGHKTTLGRT